MRSGFHGLTVRPKTRLSVSAKREVGQVRLGERDPARGTKARHDLRVAPGYMVGEQLRAARRAHACGVDGVLDRERNAVERTELAATAERSLRLPCQRLRLLDRGDERVQERVQPLGALAQAAQGARPGRAPPRISAARPGGRRRSRRAWRPSVGEPTRATRRAVPGAAPVDGAGAGVRPALGEPPAVAVHRGRPRVAANVTTAGPSAANAASSASPSRPSPRPRSPRSRGPAAAAAKLGARPSASRLRPDWRSPSKNRRSQIFNHPSEPLLRTRLTVRSPCCAWVASSPTA